MATEGKYRIMFKGGEMDGVVAGMNCTRFFVGMIFEVGDETYRIIDGPVARIFEQKQEGHPNLCAVCQLVPTAVEQAGGGNKSN